MTARATQWISCCLHGGREDSLRNTEASEWILAWEVKSISEYLQKLSHFSFFLPRLTKISCSADMIWNIALCRKQAHQAYWNYLIPILAVTLLYGTQIHRSGIHPACSCSHYKWWKKIKFVLYDHSPYREFWYFIKTPGYDTLQLKIRQDSKPTVKIICRL